MKIRSILIALVLIAAACGDDDGAATTQAPTTTAAAATTAPATTQAPATTAAPETTAAATTTTEDPFAEIIALVTAYAGDYAGEWTNTTFGSTGAITGSLAFDEATLSVTLELDIDGFVFGAFDPDPETFVISLAEAAADPDNATMIESATFGTLRAVVTREGIEMFSDQVPEPGIASVLITGPITPEGFDLAYTIEFAGGGGAEGTATLTKAG